MSLKRAPIKYHTTQRDLIADLIYKMTGLVFVTKEDSNPLTISGFLKREADMILELQGATLDVRDQAKEQIEALIDQQHFDAITAGQVDQLAADASSIISAAGTGQLALIDPLALNHMLDIAESVKAQLELDLVLELGAPTVAQENALILLNSQNNLFSGKFLTETLPDKAGEVVKKLIEKAGVDIDPAFIADALKESLGGVADLSAGYLETYSTASLNHARSYAAISSYAQARIEIYEFVNPLDNRTSSFCRAIDGRQQEVRVGMASFNRVLEATTIDQIKEISPFVKSEKDGSFSIVQEGEVINLGENPGDPILLEYNLVRPPFHPRCRTSLIPVF